MGYLDTLYDICETLMREMDKANDKIQKGGGEISSGDVDYLDKLTHAVKSVKTTIAMEESGYSNDGRMYDDGGYDGSYDGSSYARGRGMNARRDSRGRYSRDGRGYNRGGYSRDDAREELMEHLQEMEKMAKDEETRRMVKQWKKQVEQD